MPAGNDFWLGIRSITWLGRYEDVIVKETLQMAIHIRAFSANAENEM